MSCASNIITANFSGGKTSATTAALWQWDYGQVLCITGLDLPAAFEVHFSTNRTGGVSTVAVGADGQVTIPNVLLTIGKNLNAWIYLSDSEGDGETEYAITIPVKARPMPETYDAEATGVFDDVVRQVSEYAQTAQTAADNAGASASAAAASADNAAASASAAAGSAAAAEQARADAVTAKGQAETAAQTATEKAQQTAQNASQAASDAGRAESAAERAESAEAGAGAAKTAAEAAAQSAAASAATADEKATLAGQSATAAAGSASAAAQSAASIEGDVQIASQKASEATTAAGQAVTAKDAAVTARQGAETAATNAGQSASTATAKAAEAAQSASGAAQSKTDAEAAATRAEQAAATLTVDTALSDTSTNPVQNKVITSEITDVKTAIDALKIVDTASGAIASFPDGAAMPMESLTVDLEPIQDLNGQDAPYPAGVTANLIPDGTDTENGYEAGKRLNSDGSTATDANCYISEYFPVTEGETYTWSSDKDLNSPSICFYDASKTYISGVQASQALPKTFTAPAGAVYSRSTQLTMTYGGIIQLEVGSTATTPMYYSNICPITGRESVTVTRTGKNLMPYSASDFETGNVLGNGRFLAFTVPAGTYTVSTSAPTGYIWAGKRFVNTSILRVYAGSPLTLTLEDGESIYIGLLKTDIDAAYAYGVQVEPGSTASSYEPYNGQTATIQLGQTVYGGMVDVTTGVMTVTWAAVDMGSLTWSMDNSSTSYYYFMASIADKALNTQFICSMYNNTHNIRTQLTDCTMGIFNTNSATSFRRVVVRDDSYTSAADFKTAVTGQAICYKLATPQTIQLTAEQMTTLKGQNNVWSDADSVTVEYVADPKLYIARLTEPDADMVADANITSGSYFMVGNNLYLATANIASGATITPGVNCTKTNLSSALNAINS